MQIAVNVLLFFLGLYLPTLVALKHRIGGKDVRSLASRLCRLADVLLARQRPGDSRSHDSSKSSSTTVSKLLTKEDVETDFDFNSWQRLAYEEFKTTILAKGTGLKTFPCVYATMGYRAGDHRYVFLESDDPSEPRNIRIVAPALKEYLRISRSLGPNTSMVIMAAPSEGALKLVEEYNDGFWEMLRGLRIWDSTPWPAEFPQDTLHEKWTYCFDGQPLFPVALSPAHQKRWSRHAPVSLVALQPKWVLDNLLGTPEKRESATSKVRKLLMQYDQIDISPDLTSYGEVGTSEIHQLCLRDENETAFCPFQDFDKGSRRTSMESRRSSMESQRS